jgi:hypothetical protein
MYLAAENCTTVVTLRWQVDLDGDAFNVPSSSLSGGQRRRLSLGIALIGVLSREPQGARPPLPPRSYPMVPLTMHDAMISGSDVNSFCYYGLVYLLDSW